MNTKHTTVSIIIPAFNATETLPRCLDSVLYQNYPADNINIHIVNDGSTDNIDDVLQKFSLPRHFKIHTHKTNQGLSAARNTGITNSGGEIIIFLDADMEVSPNFVKNHVQMHKRSNVVGVLSALLPAPENPIDKYQKYLYRSKRGAQKYPPLAPLPFHVFILGITSVKRFAISESGGFDYKISSYGGEDTEFAYRLWQKYPQGLFYAPHIKVIHHHYRPFNEVLNNVRTFGQDVVPYLVQKHPEFDRLYGYSFIYPPSTLSGLLKKVAGTVLKSKITFSILKLLYHLSPYPISNRFIRLLLASALWQGIAG
ncbi:MAG: glycosyltransferase family 2 protein [Candidatus Marinimicrobia bacterium]|nr:glycosyltransferase family 2 protein [Candidatus Neomarinimicrobiota bacterium]